MPGFWINATRDPKISSPTRKPLGHATTLYFIELLVAFTISFSQDMNKWISVSMKRISDLVSFQGHASYRKKLFYCSCFNRNGNIVIFTCIHTHVACSGLEPQTLQHHNDTLLCEKLILPTFPSENRVDNIFCFILKSFIEQFNMQRTFQTSRTPFPNIFMVKYINNSLYKICKLQNYMFHKFLLLIIKNKTNAEATNNLIKNHAIPSLIQWSWYFLFKKYVYLSSVTAKPVLRTYSWHVLPLRNVKKEK